MSAARYVTPFLADTGEICRRVRSRLADARPPLAGDRPVRRVVDRRTTIKLLNDLLAAETLCVLRLRRQPGPADGRYVRVGRRERDHAQDEQRHAEWLAERIRQLGGEPTVPAGEPDGEPAGERHGVATATDLLREDLAAERLAIETYREVIDLVHEGDPVTRRLLTRILADEEEHAAELRDLLSSIDPTRPI